MTDQEKSKITRKPTKPNVDLVVKAIERGEYDGDDLMRINDASRERFGLMRDQVLKQVKLVFGPDATVTTTAKENPFVQQAKRSPLQQLFAKTDQEAPEADDAESDEDKITPDALEDVVGEEPPSAPPLPSDIPIEQRGAVISGMHSSQMGN